MDFTFCMHIHRVNENKSPRKILGKVVMGVVRVPKIFMAPMAYMECIVRSSYV